MQGLNRIDLLFGFLLCLIGFGPGALSSQLKASEDKAPLFCLCSTLLRPLLLLCLEMLSNYSYRFRVIPFFPSKCIPTDLVWYSRNFVSQR